MVHYAEGLRISLMKPTEFRELWKKIYSAQLDAFDPTIDIRAVVRIIGSFQDAVAQHSITFPDTLDGRAAYATALSDIYGLYGCGRKFLHERLHAESATRMRLTPKFGMLFVKADGENIRGDACNGSIRIVPFVIDDLSRRLTEFSEMKIREYLQRQKNIDLFDGDLT